MSPSLDRCDDGTGSQEEGGGGAGGADPIGGQLGGSERDWGVGSSGELSITAEVHVVGHSWANPRWQSLS